VLKKPFILLQNKNIKKKALLLGLSFLCNKVRKNPLSGNNTYVATNNDNENLKNYTWPERISAVPDIFRSMFKGDFKGILAGRTILLLLGVLYIISPFDFLPEIVLGPLGLADDAGVFALCVALFMQITGTYMAAHEPLNEPIIIKGERLK
jgi:uncharacterized membrane protein YkvA (DUF1232 family)